MFKIMIYSTTEQSKYNHILCLTVNLNDALLLQVVKNKTLKK